MKKRYMHPVLLTVRLEPTAPFCGTGGSSFSMSYGASTNNDDDDAPTSADAASYRSTLWE